MEKKFKIVITESDLDFITALIDISLKVKGIEILNEINMLKSNIQTSILEITEENKTI